MHPALTIQCIVKFLLVNFQKKKGNWSTVQGYDSNKFTGMRSEVGILIPNNPYLIF